MRKQLQHMWLYKQHTFRHIRLNFIAQGSDRLKPGRYAPTYSIGHFFFTCCTGGPPSSSVSIPPVGGVTCLVVSLPKRTISGTVDICQTLGFVRTDGRTGYLSFLQVHNLVQNQTGPSILFSANTVQRSIQKDNSVSLVQTFFIYCLY